MRVILCESLYRSIRENSLFLRVCSYGRCSRIVCISIESRIVSTLAKCNVQFYPFLKAWKKSPHAVQIGSK